MLITHKDHHHTDITHPHHLKKKKNPQSYTTNPNLNTQKRDMLFTHKDHHHTDITHPHHLKKKNLQSYTTSPNPNTQKRDKPINLLKEEVRISYLFFLLFLDHFASHYAEAAAATPATPAKATTFG